MNQHEAKFLLRAFRPDGQDARDPVFTEALAQAESDPKLKAWFDREASFDRTMRAKLREVQPPAGLREAILAGSRASRQRRSWWQNPAWLAVAAAIAIAFTVALKLHPSGPSAQEFAEFALHDLADSGATHKGEQPELQARFANATLPLPGHTKVDADEMRRLGCRTVSFAGHEVFEICFVRDGKSYHLYASNVKNFASGAVEAKALVLAKGRFNATAWKALNLASTPSGGKNIYHSDCMAMGRRATMPMVITKEIPLPIPRSVICSPSHMRSRVPVVSSSVVRMR